MSHLLRSDRWRLRAEGACAVVLILGGVRLGQAAWGPVAPEATAAALATPTQATPADPSEADGAPPQPNAATPAHDGAPRRLRFRAARAELQVEAGAPCAASARLPKGMSTLSEDALSAVALEGHSPLRLEVGGAALPKRSPEAPCAAGFAIQGRQLTWAGAPGEAAALTLDPALPLRGPAGLSWWVYSGSGAAWSVALQPGDALHLEAATVGGKAGVLPEVELDGLRLPLHLEERRATLTAELSAAASALVIDVPQGGPHLVLRALELRRGAERIDLLAAP